MHINIQSLSAKFDNLKNLVETLQENGVELNLILLCETFLYDGNSNLFELPGYNLAVEVMSQYMLNLTYNTTLEMTYPLFYKFYSLSVFVTNCYYCVHSSEINILSYPIPKYYNQGQKLLNKEVSVTDEVVDGSSHVTSTHVMSHFIQYIVISLWCLYYKWRLMS